MGTPNIIIQDSFLAYNKAILFNKLNITFAAGKWSCLLGPSGVGKSSLLRMIAGLTTENTLFQGTIKTDHPDMLLSKHISYMAQTDLLMPWLSALDNALIASRLNKQYSPEKLQQAKDLFAQVGLHNAMDLYPRELSGGMRQRVALIRTLLQNKPIILMDEPFSALDAITRFQLQTLAAELLRNRTVIFVTHDPQEALRLADDIYILSGRPAILSSPLKLITSTPRDLTDPELLQHQANLFHALLQAKESSL